MKECAMNEAEKDNKQRNIEIAENESARQTSGDIRVSTWAIAIMALIAIAFFGWMFAR
jgi:hypothetical protein